MKDFRRHPERFVQGWFIEKTLERGQLVYNYIETEACENKIEHLRLQGRMEDWLKLTEKLSGYQCPLRKGKLPLGISQHSDFHFVFASC